jgi:hypothetical protein
MSHNQSNGSFVWLAPDGSAGGPGGCELSLGQDLAQHNFPTQTVYMVKVSQGATALSNYWKPGTGANYLTGCGTGWNNLYTDVNAACATIRSQGNNPVLKGFFWHQGEADSGNTTDANAYEGRLRAFITDIRDMFAAPNMPFFVGSMGNITAGGYAYSGTTIYNAEKAVSVSLGAPGGINYTGSSGPLANTYFVNLYDVPNDGLHFTGAGYVTMGDRFAATFDTVTPEPATLTLLGLGAAAFVARRRRLKA